MPDLQFDSHNEGKNCKLIFLNLKKMSTHRSAAGAPSHAPLLLHNPMPCQGKQEAKAVPKPTPPSAKKTNSTPVL